MDIGSTVEIARGVSIPLLGLGTYKSQDGPEVEHAVASALAEGYRGIDTASLYGNEAGVGRAIAASGVPRHDIFIATKVWNDEQGFDATLAAFEGSAERLGVEYIDLYLVHWPKPSLMGEAWRAMEELHALGKVRAIGVCNHLVHHLEMLLRIAAIPPAVDQIEFHPRLQQPDVQAFCREQGITLQAWAPILRGAVADIPEIAEIASRHDRTPVQVTLRWILQKGHVTIPKSVHAERIRENADVFDFALDEREMAVMESLDTEHRIGPHPDGYAE